MAWRRWRRWSAYATAWQNNAAMRDWRRAAQPAETTEVPDHRYDPERPWLHAFTWRDGVLRPLLTRQDFWAIYVGSILLRVLTTNFEFDTQLHHMVDDVPQVRLLCLLLLLHPAAAPAC
jgi:hypothetical protein